MKKFLCLMLCVCLLATVFVSCNNKPKDPVVTTDGQQQTTTGTPEPVTPPEASIKVEDLENYVIIYAEKATTDLVRAADDLADLIKEKLDITVKVESDYYEEDEKDEAVGEYEILLGNTNRQESIDLLASLSYRDYGYAMVGNKIVINAHDDYSATLAVKAFMETVVTPLTENSEDFMKESQTTVKKDTYNLGAITVGDAKIADFTIVYPEANDAMEQYLAEKVRDAIAASCGTVLTVVSDETAASGKEILVGKTNRTVTLTDLGEATDKGYMALENGNVVLAGNNAYGTALAVDAFIDTFADAAAASTLAISITNGVVADTATGFTSMTFNVNSTGGNKAAYVKRVVATIVKYLPDTVGLQECTSKWSTELKAALSPYYTFVGVGRDTKDGTDSGQANLVLYKTEKFTAVASGTKWLSSTPDVCSSVQGADNNCIYTYVELETKGDTPVKILHVNTTLDTANTDVRQTQASVLLEFLYQNKDKATVLTGDMNCYADSTEFKLLICEDMNDAAAIAEKADTMDDETMDFLLVLDEFIDVTLVDVLEERIYGDFASDRDAIYMEYVVDYNGTDVKKKDLTGDGLIVVPDRDGSEMNDPTIIF